MLRNYFVINIILVIMLGFLGFKFYGVATYSMDVPDAASVEEGEKTDSIEIKLKDRVPDKASFDIISRNDLFRPSRSASFADGTTISKRGGQDMYPKLFATIIQGSNSTAIMQDPGTKKTKTYRANDLIAGFQILEIREDRVILVQGGERVEVKLRDDKGIKAVRPKPLIRQNPKRPRPGKGPGR